MSDTVFDFVTGLFFWAVMVLLTFPFAFLFGLAWNHVAPLFHLPSLDYWQSFAVLYLVHQIFPGKVIRVADHR